MIGSPTIFLAAIGSISWVIYTAFYRVYWHLLAKFPGPRAAAVTNLYRAYVDCIRNRSFAHALEKKHRQYGDIVRVGPNELHFATPQAYLDIYNPQNRWDKEKSVYHSFGEARSSFGFLTYREAKERRDVLSRSFSRMAVLDTEAIITDKVVELCDSFKRHTGEPIDLLYAFRCMSMDVITYLCFAKLVNAMRTPDYKPPIILAMDTSLPVFLRFKHASLYKNMIMRCPPKLSKVMSPATAGLLLQQQIREIFDDPTELQKLPHSRTIYHELLRPEAYRSRTVPSSGSLYEEAQALMFAGADTTGTTLTHGSFYILSSREVYNRIKRKLVSAWPNLDCPPSWSELERLPYLTAVIKESLRMSPGVASPLPRVVPPSGGRVLEMAIPGNVVVGMSSHFVHRDARIFEQPDEFILDRWLGEKGQSLDKWLMSFSPSTLEWRDCFLPEYIGPHLRARMTPVRE